MFAIASPLAVLVSTAHSADQNVSDASTWLRDQGLVPWEWIVDETRSLTAYMYANTIADYIIDSVDRARIDLWDGLPPPLIICESRTFGGILARTLAQDYLCPVTATNGQAGGFLRTNVAPELENERAGVLYIGDLDLRGADIEANTRLVLEHELGRALTTGTGFYAKFVPLIGIADVGPGPDDVGIECNELDVDIEYVDARVVAVALSPN